MRKTLFFLTFVFYCNLAFSCDKGINLVGAGFSPGILPGTEGVHYKFPTRSHVDYYHSKGFDCVRLSLIWERLQPGFYEKLDDVYLSHVIDFLASAKNYGMTVVLDLHNYGRYNSRPLRVEDIPAFVDFWIRFYNATKLFEDGVIFGLMNEPVSLGAVWKDFAQAAVTSLRMAGYDGRIYVAGHYWSGAANWSKNNFNNFIDDPADNFFYEAHLYFDDDSSGVYKKTNEARSDYVRLVRSRISEFAEWIAGNNVRGVIGEWGVPNNDEFWLAVVQEVLIVACASKLTTFYWAGGWWPSNYFFSTEPVATGDRDITKMISRFSCKS